MTFQRHTKPAVAFFLLCAALLPLSANAEPSPASIKAHEEGLRLLKENKPAEAASQFEAAARQGNTDAQNELAKLYLLGTGVTKDPAKAQKLFQDSADGGNIRGMTNLGLMYKGDRGIKEDYAKAAHWLTKAAELGQPLAQYELAFLYVAGLGVERSPGSALAWYTKAGNQGMPKAQYYVGLYYLDGIGMKKPDSKVALEWFVKAAASKDPQILTDIGVLLLDEESDIYDLKGAVSLFTEAANAGHRDAQYRLGDLYHKGRGVKKDIDAAFKLFNAAARQGQTDAMGQLALMYLTGEGVEKNALMAYVMADLANDGGALFARATREAAATSLTPEQLEQAKAAVQRNREAAKKSGK